MKKYRFHSDEFKREVISAIDSGVISLAETCRKYDLAESMVYRWREKIHEGSMKPRKSPYERQLEKEIERCKLKIADLSLENDLLKKINETYPPLKRSNGYVVTPRISDQSREPAE